MADETPDRDPEIRRRAAWLLGMLALVAALFVALMVTFFNTSGGQPDPADIAEPSGLPSTSASSTPGPSSTNGSTGPSRPGSDGAGSSTGSGAPGSSAGSGTGSSSDSGKPASCPSSDPCALSTDIGNAVAAINAYRTDNGKSAVPGAVSSEATACALSNGSDCSGSWAQTQVPAKNGRPDGTQAVDKIKQLGKLLSDMKSIEVGWAYDPGARTFYFAIVRQD